MRAHPSANVRALIVWEPVLATDWWTPSPSLTSMIPDRRAAHFWDHDRRLSALLGGRERLDLLAREKHVGFAMKKVIWDAAFVYPPDANWGAPADLLLAPVVEFSEELDAALAGR